MVALITNVLSIDNLIKIIRSTFDKIMDNITNIARYIILNPVRAGMVRTAKDWPWSSYRATAGWLKAAPWLHTDWILSAFSRERKTACEYYQAFVSQGRGQPSPWENLKNQVFLDSEPFVTDMQGLIDPEKTLEEIPQEQKRVLSKPLSDYEQTCRSRDEAIYAAYQSGGYKMVELAKYFGLHYSSVSKIIRGIENSKFQT